MKNDLLEISTFKRLWKEKETNPKFCALLSYLQINIQMTELIESEQYIILYDKEKEEYIVLISELHPLKEDFLEEKERLQMKKQRWIYIDDKN